MSSHIMFPDLYRPALRCFLNDSEHPFRLDGKYWRTVTHYMLAMQFAGTPVEEEIRRCATLAAARKISDSHKIELGADWRQVKMTNMRRAVLAKFRAHADIQAVLLDTGRAGLIQRSRHYTPLPDGRFQSDNILGSALMSARSSLRRSRKRQSMKQDAAQPKSQVVSEPLGFE